MAESFIRLPADGSGKKTRTRTFSVGGNTVHHSVVEVASFATLLAVDSGDSTISYIGKALAGTATSASSWQIQKLTETANITIEYADGNNDFDNIFDNRESLSYS